MRWFTFFISLVFFSCQGQTTEKELNQLTSVHTKIDKVIETDFDKSTKTIHVFVALCDNTYQGIVPVSKNLGNGQNPNTNLYWGSAFGIRTYFKRSKEWKLIEKRSVDSLRIERLIFQHKNKNYYLVADAYNGKYIKQTTLDFLKSSAGKLKDTIQIQNKTIGIGGHAKLCSYIGHDGLMDFTLSEQFENKDNLKRDAIVLACYSKHFFAPHLKKANINPLIWTTGLMAPEAYTLHDALQAYINKQGKEMIRNKAAAAYAKYQKCGLRAAKRLLVSGW